VPRTLPDPVPADWQATSASVTSAIQSILFMVPNMLPPRAVESQTEELFGVGNFLA
jgi:hypothetical protein